MLPDLIQQGVLATRQHARVAEAARLEVREEPVAATKRVRPQQVVEGIAETPRLLVYRGLHRLLQAVFAVMFAVVFVAVFAAVFAAMSMIHLCAVVFVAVSLIYPSKSCPKRTHLSVV
jgi:Flp pilus assembly protein TadB